MKRIARSNKIYSLLLTFSRRQRLMATAGILCVIVISWYLLLYQPLNSRMNSCQKKITENGAGTSQCADLHAQTAQLEQKLERDERQLQQYMSKRNSHDYLATIAKLGHQSTVCIENCSLETIEEKEGAHVLPIMINGHGTIPQLTDFFTKIAAVYETAAPSQITIDHIKDNVFQLNMRLVLLNLKN